MKKYQLWLQRKTYSQHLTNLMRIKMTSTDRKVNSKLSMQGQRGRELSPNQTIIKSQQPLTQREIKYIITSRELQKHKMRLVRSNEIVRQNQQMAKRINNTRPFISNNNPVDYSSYKLKRKMQRANEEHSSELKLKNYNEFMRLHQEKIDPQHRYQLKISMKELDFRLPSAPNTEIALEIVQDNRLLSKCEYLQPQDLEERTFMFSFPDELPHLFTLRIHAYKGLEHQIVASYHLQRPDQGSPLTQNWPSTDSIGHLVASLTYKRIAPTLWTNKRFKV